MKTVRVPVTFDVEVPDEITPQEVQRFLEDNLRLPNYMVPDGWESPILRTGTPIR